VNIVEFEITLRVPKFFEKEEDVKEWIAQVKALFTASGRQLINHNANLQ